MFNLIYIGKLQKTEKETEESLKSLISQLQEKDKKIYELTKNMEGTHISYYMMMIFHL